MFYESSFLLQPWQGLPQLNSLCFWEENLATFLQLTFLASLLVKFLWKQIRISGIRESVKEDKGAQRCPVKKSSDGRIKLDLSYRFSIFCCSVPLATHFLNLLFLLLGEEKGHCKSVLTVILSNITQTISWSVATIAVINFQKEESSRVPWILRLWWICSFLQSFVTIILHMHSIISTKQFPKAAEYASLLNLLASSYLFFISIRGTTGISISAGTITEPLLHEDTKKHAETKIQSLYAKATLIQLVTFSWLNPLFAIGIRKPLEQDEVPDVDIKDSAEFLSCSFDACLKSVKETYGLQSSIIYRAIFLFIRKKAAINAMFAVVTACASYVGPYLIDDLVKFLSGKKKYSLRSGYILSFAFLGAKIVETVTQRQWIFGARQLGMRLRAALISHIYKKGINLSSLSRQSHTSGEIINYMSVDIQRITDFIWYLNTIWMLPIQISLAIYILHMNLGIGSLAGLAATGIIMACNIPITRTQKRFQSKIMEAKDERMKATSEVLRNMKTLKLHAWDSQYLSKLESLRKTEHKCLWKSLRLQAISAFVFWGAPTFISSVTFGACILMGVPLTAGRVLSALATFRMLQDPIFNLPDLLSVIAQAKVSIDRVASYLQEDEIQADAVEFITKNEGENDIEIDGGRFSWDPESSLPTLGEIQLTIKRGMKVAICGTVGSGKSSLLSCILGEIPKLAGTVKVGGSKAYVPQSPWILTGNVRENILFGKPYESDKYEKTIQACALAKDFQLFASGDLTEIGERGINMSGGQKQRIQIARAVYQDTDIYLLDDPFSAVDAHTGTQLFEDCLMGILKEKTILYVTHQVEFLPAADLILVMKNGRITQAGRFEELLQENVGFEMLVGAHSQALESILAAGNSHRLTRTDDRRTMELPSQEETEEEHVARIQFQNSDKHNSEQNLSINIVEKGRITQDEEREKGSIGKEVYWSYLTAVKSGAFVPFILTAQSLFQILQVASNYWMAWASPPTDGIEPTVRLNILFLVYIILSFVSSLCVLLRATLIATAGLQTSEKFFTNMLHSIMRAPMSFFDSTPTGRILNRASTDQSVLDLEMAGKLGWCAFSVIQILGTIVVMSQVAWPVFAIFIPVTAVCIWYQQYYIPTARELARLSGIRRAPILHHFAESLSGASVIRAFEHGERFSRGNLCLIDRHSRPWFHNVSAMEWLSFRLNLLSHFVFAFSLVLLVSLPDGFISPNIAGLAVTYGLSLNVQQASIIWNMCNAENKMISVERILQYSRIKSEAPLHVEGCKPPISWPQIGTICFRNLQIRYAEHLPYVLKHITCTFPGNKKIGVVGRTGSGKSTLIQAIFRIVEPTEGSIVIDGIDICKIGLHDLRSRLSIIPQDPTMFEGTVRANLDPMEEYSDLQVWEALDKCQLGDLVHEKEKKLDATVVENGENWSAGQRQLFCLGRALLKRGSILVLDEATASVDSATDSTIQQIIRQEFKDNTVVTIAHRIHTVIDSDLVLVLSEGKVQEYDAPAKLLEREDSAFSKLIKEYSLRSHSFNNLANISNAVS
uniref:ABC transporter C family member 9 n=2 Tax=Anthurium amnicola TaxID=1678845 RepID=A0A1D1Z236_9ARAE